MGRLTPSGYRQTDGGLYVPATLSLHDRVREVRGEVEVWLATPKGGWELAHRGHNLYLNYGYARLARWAAALAPTAPGYIAVGNGNGTVAGLAVTVAPTDPQLDFELLRVALTSASAPSTYTTRLATLFTAAQVARQLTEVGLFDHVGDSGTAAGGSQSTTTLGDSGKAWTINQWAGYTLYITNAADGDAVKKATIASNTATVLTLTSALTTVPVAATTTYTVGGIGSAGTDGMLARAAVSTLKGAQQMNVIWSFSWPAA